MPITLPGAVLHGLSPQGRILPPPMVVMAVDDIRITGHRVFAADYSPCADRCKQQSHGPTYNELIPVFPPLSPFRIVKRHSSLIQYRKARMSSVT
jgi:hypothetical protein